MKTRSIVVALALATLLAIVSAALVHPRPPAVSSSSAQPRIFHLAGKIVALNPAGRTVRIAHEEIPGYMPAMTMPFHVPNPGELKGLRAGDAVEFRLTVSENDSWVDQIETRKLLAPDSRPVNPPRETAQIGLEADPLQVGETVPDFALIDQNGRPVQIHQFRGQAVVLTFVYTRCPLPNFCPLMSKNFASLQDRLQKKAPGRFHLLSVSIDPEFDRPEVLKSYAIRYNAAESDWTFATGRREQIDLVASSFGLTHEPENGFIAHDLRTALISPDGKLLKLWKSNVWTPYEIEREVLAALERPGDRLAVR